MLLLKFKNMKITENTLNNLKAEYNSWKPFPTGHLAPRRGFYFIKEISYKSIGSIDNVPIAKTHWTSNGMAFFEEVEFKIELLSLFQPSSIGDTYLQYHELVKRVIQIKNGGTKIFENETKSIKYYWVNWTVTLVKIPIVKGEVENTSANAKPFDGSFLSLADHFENPYALMVASFNSLGENHKNQYREAICQESEDSTIVEDHETDHFDENPVDTDLSGFDPKAVSK